MNLTPEFMEAIKRHRRLVDTLGMDHPDTMRAMMLAMELAPKELIDEFGDMAREIGLSNASIVTDAARIPET